MGLSTQKVKYVTALSAAAIAGELENDSFRGLTDEDAITRLCKIPGVGRWTAEVGLFRGLGRLDVFPADDLGLQVAAQQVLQLPHRPIERWQPWRSYAALYLWAHLQDSAGTAT